MFCTETKKGIVKLNDGIITTPVTLSNSEFFCGTVNGLALLESSLKTELVLHHAICK